MMFTKNLFNILLFLVIINIYETMANVDEIEVQDSPVQYDNDNTDPTLLTFDLLKGFELMIPEECKNTHFCENIPNYPEEIMKKLIKNLEESVMFNKDTLTTRVSSHDDTDSLHLCETERKTYIPKAVVDENGKWNLVINSNDNPIQIFSGEICKDQDSFCNNACFESCYRGKCYQSYIYHQVQALNEDMNKVVKRSINLPSCCHCRAYRTRMY